MKSLYITVRYLQRLSHGRGDDSEPQWPPSPLRMFQALVAAAAGRWNEREILVQARESLQWLLAQPRPTILAARGTPSRVRCQFYVPDNTGELVVPAWKRDELTKTVKRTEKVVCPTHLAGEAVRYLFVVDADSDKHFATLQAAARSITHLGWGIDMVAGDAQLLTDELVAKLEGERWQPTPDRSGTALRVPIPGTLEALMKKHHAFLNRLSEDGFKPVPPLTTFDVVGYRRATDPVVRPFTVFQILDAGGERVRAFETVRRCCDVAGWVRHTVGTLWPFNDKESFVHGHAGPNRQIKGELADQRLMFLPLPSIERRGDHGLHVGAIRRVLIAAPAGHNERITWIRRHLSGQDLVSLTGEVVGMLNLVPRDWVIEQYCPQLRHDQWAKSWSTVTPVVLPGHDDRNPRKAERLLRKAFLQAGLSAELIASVEELEYRPVGFRTGADLASRYRRDEHMQGPVYHVCVRFAHPLPGPLAIGAGRYRGFGLFAVDE